MGGLIFGVEVVKKVFGKFSEMKVNLVVFGKVEVDLMFEGMLRVGLFDFIIGEGICKGYFNLWVGKVFEIVGVGKKFGGFYYLMIVEYFYLVIDGY